MKLFFQWFEDGIVAAIVRGTQRGIAKVEEMAEQERSKITTEPAKLEAPKQTRKRK